MYFSLPILYISCVTKIKVMQFKHLKNLSCEKLSYREFKEYITDYLNNCKEYGIDKRSRYFKEIKHSTLNLESSYKQYCSLFN